MQSCDFCSVKRIALLHYTLKNPAFLIQELMRLMLLDPLLGSDRYPAFATTSRQLQDYPPMIGGAAPRRERPNLQLNSTTAS